jgi:hypothetical protein
MLWYSGAIFMGLGSAAGGLFGLINHSENEEPDQSDQSEQSFREKGSPQPPPIESCLESSVENLLSKLKTLVPRGTRETVNRVSELYVKVVASLELVSSNDGKRYTISQQMKILHQASSFMNLLRMHFDKLHQGARYTIQASGQNTEEEYETYQVALRAEFDMINEVIEDLQGQCLNLMS